MNRSFIEDLADRPVSSQAAVEAIFEQVRRHCLRAANVQGRLHLEGHRLQGPSRLVGTPLRKVLSKLRLPFSTQELGGLEVHQPYTRAEAQAYLKQQVASFPGLTLGIEASLASCITDLPRFSPNNQQQEAVVYSQSGRLLAAVHRSELSGGQGLT